MCLYKFTWHRLAGAPALAASTACSRGAIGDEDYVHVQLLPGGRATVIARTCRRAMLEAAGLAGLAAADVPRPDEYAGPYAWAPPPPDWAACAPPVCGSCHGAGVVLTTYGWQECPCETRKRMLP